MGSRLRVMQPFTSDSQNLARPLDPGVEEMAAVFTGAIPNCTPTPGRADETYRGTLVQLARHIGRVPGRKSLIWLSGGIPLTPWDADPKGLSAEMARAARALSDSGIAIYPVDAGALFAPGKRRPGTEYWTAWPRSRWAALHLAR